MDRPLILLLFPSIIPAFLLAAVTVAAQEPDSFREAEATLRDPGAKDDRKQEAALQLLKLWPESREAVEQALLDDSAHTHFFKWLYASPDLAPPPGPRKDLPVGAWIREPSPRPGRGGFRAFGRPTIGDKAYGELASRIAAKLSDADPVVRRRAARALCHFGVGAERGVEPLLEAIDRDDSGRFGFIPARDELVAYEVNALSASGTTDPRALTLLTSLSRSGFDKIRLAAVRGLGEIRIQSLDAMSVLVESLKDSNSDVQLAAALSLGAYGPRARQAARQMADLFDRRRNLLDRSLILQAIKQVDPKTAEGLRVEPR